MLGVAWLRGQGFKYCESLSWILYCQTISHDSFNYGINLGYGNLLLCYCCKIVLCIFTVRQCTYTVFFLQCQKFQSNCQIIETCIDGIIFKGVLYHVSSCTVVVSCPLLYMNQVPEKLALHPWLNNAKFLWPLYPLTPLSLFDPFRTQNHTIAWLKELFVF
jgi:hypothetical protein